MGRVVVSRRRKEGLLAVVALTQHEKLLTLGLHWSQNG